MSKICAFVNQKGGVGKTTLTVLLANILSQKPFSHKVCVIDADGQNSIIDARKQDLETYEGEVAPYDVLSYNVATILSNIERLDQNYDYILIDLAGRLDNEVEKATMLLDYAFVVFTAGNYSLESSTKFLRKAAAIRKKKEPDVLELYGILNRTHANRVTSTNLKEETDQLPDILPIQFIKTQIREYTVLNELDTFEKMYYPNSKQGQWQNITSWFDEIYNIIKH